MLLLLTTDISEITKQARENTLPRSIEWQWQIETMEYFGYKPFPVDGFQPQDEDLHYIRFESEYRARQIFLNRPQPYSEQSSPFDMAIIMSYHPVNYRAAKEYWQQIMLLPKLDEKRHNWRKASNLATAKVASAHTLSSVAQPTPHTQSHPSITKPYVH